MAELDKCRYQEGAHVLGFHCQAVLRGVQNAFGVGIHKLAGLANEGLRQAVCFFDTTLKATS